MRTRRLLLHATLSLGLSVTALLMPPAAAEAATLECTETEQLECGNYFRCPDDQSTLPCSCPGMHPVDGSCLAGGCDTQIWNMSWICTY